MLNSYSNSLTLKGTGYTKFWKTWKHRYDVFHQGRGGRWVTFKTPRLPLITFGKLSKQFPKLTITLEYLEIGADFAGRVVWKKGKRIEQEYGPVDVLRFNWAMGE